MKHTELILEKDFNFQIENLLEEVSREREDILNFKKELEEITAAKAEVIKTMKQWKN